MFTAHQFQEHVNAKYGEQLQELHYSGSAAKRENPRGISLTTATRWLHVLGYCTDKATRGAVFNDGRPGLCVLCAVVVLIILCRMCEVRAPFATCTCAAHEREDVVKARMDLIAFLDSNAHRIIKPAGSAAEVLALLLQPYERVFTEAEQALLGVKLATLPDGTQERPLLVRTDCT